MKTHVLMLVVAVALGFGLGPQAKACDGYGYGGWGSAWLYQSLQYNVPYFAAFPPVYYSYPVPRTYGYSPFAYPPGVMTPDVTIDPQPQEIINPYVPSTRLENSEKAAAKPDTTAAASRQPEPLVILNPYVMGAKSLAQAEE